MIEKKRPGFNAHKVKAKKNRRRQRRIRQINRAVDFNQFLKRAHRRKPLHAALNITTYGVPKMMQCRDITLRYAPVHWSVTQRNIAALHHFRHAIRSYVERSVQWFAPVRTLEKLVEVDSAIDLTNPSLPPTIFLGFHFVGIETGSLFLNHLLQRRCGALYQPISNPRIECIAKQARSRFNAEMVSRADSARAVLRMLRARMPVMLGADMDYGARNSAFVPFFGVSACTLTAVSRLAKAAGAQVVPFISEVLPHYRGYRLKVFEAWKEYPSGDPLKDARRMNAFLEAQIQRMPEQYYWVHRRFKTRPPGEPSVY